MPKPNLADTTIYVCSVWTLIIGAVTIFEIVFIADVRLAGFSRAKMTMENRNLVV